MGALRGDEVSFLFKASGPHLSSFGSGSDAWDRPWIQWKNEDGSTSTLPPLASDWQYRNQSTPDQTMNDDTFGLSIGKWRPFPLVDGREGSQRQVLMRWRLPASASKASEAVLVVPKNSRKAYLSQVHQGKAGAIQNPGSHGDLEAHLLQHPDTLWHAQKATWNRLDGSRNWSGGEVNRVKRREGLLQLSKEDLPAPALKRIEKLLEGL